MLVNLLVLAWLLLTSPTHAMPAPSPTPTMRPTYTLAPSPTITRPTPAIAAPAFANAPAIPPAPHTDAPRGCDWLRIDCPIPSLSYNEFQQILTTHNGAILDWQAWYIYNRGKSYGVDSAWLLAFWCRESTCASAGRVAHYCFNAGNFVVSDNAPPCYYNTHYRSYASFDEAADDWYSHIRRYYIDEGIIYIPDVVNKYFPASVDGNNPAEYTRQIERWISFWRQQDANRP